MHVAFHAPAYSVANAMGGVGVRVWELAQAMADAVDVVIVSRGGSDLDADGVTFVDAGDELACRHVLDRAAAVVFYDLPDPRELIRLHERGTFIVSEIAAPIEHLEYHAIRVAPDPDCRYDHLVAGYELQVLLSDHFLVQSSVARATLVTSLCHLRRLVRDTYDASATLDHLLSPIPLGYSRAARARAAGGRPTLPATDFVWSGGLWDYYDPVAVVRAVTRLEQVGRPVTVRFLYPPPPDQVLREADRLRTEVDRLGVGARVMFLTPAPGHTQRDGVLLSSRGAVCVAKPGIENATCVRLRLRDTVLYRLPLVVDPFGATATEVLGLGIGLVANPGDATELVDALDTLAHDRTVRDDIVERIDLVRRQFLVDDYVAPVLAAIRERRRPSDAGTAAHARRVAALLERHPELRDPPRYPW